MTRHEEAVEFVKKCGYTGEGVAERIVEKHGIDLLLEDKAQRMADGESPYYREKQELPSSSPTPVVYRPK